jgi:hypothetical protein
MHTKISDVGSFSQNMQQTKSSTGAFKGNWRTLTLEIFIKNCVHFGSTDSFQYFCFMYIIFGELDKFIKARIQFSSLANFENKTLYFFALFIYQLRVHFR